jgi:hypothetical protein
MTVIGITGHRILAEQDKITSGLNAALEHIACAYPDQPLQLLSPLAEGADCLAAQQALQDPHHIEATSYVYSLGRVIAWVLSAEKPIPNIPLIPEQAGWRELVQDMAEMEKDERLPDKETVLQRLEALKNADELVVTQLPEDVPESIPPQGEGEVDDDLGYSLDKE